MKRRAAAALLLGCVVALGACGDDDDDDSGQAARTATEAVAPPALSTKELRRPPRKTAREVRALLQAPTATATSPEGSPPNGYYLCWQYSGGYPTFAGAIYVLSEEDYAGPGEDDPGKYEVGGSSEKGRELFFLDGAYGGWAARWYVSDEGTPVVEIFNDEGSLGNGCPKSD